MRIDFELARLIATAAITEPYRQTNVLTTRDFARYLKDRDIRLHWATIHHLWELGVLHPIVVLEPAITGALDGNRFRELDLQCEVPSFVDLGQEATRDSDWSPPITSLSSGLSDSLLWHPFQLWFFYRLARNLEINAALDASLSGSEAYAELAQRLVSQVPERMERIANEGEHTAFQRVLALLLLVEPVVHVSISSSISFHPHLGESLDEYFSWRESLNSSALLSSVGLAVEEVERWHHNLAAIAHISDPVNNLRILLRHANRRKLEKLEGRALLALGFYDMAEVLRRYLEQFHGRELLEEDDVIYGAQSPDVKQRFYGSRRTADFDRTVFRRIVRDFDLDPQARTTWFVEGDTEEAYIRRISERLHIDLHRAGIEVMNLNGLGGLSSDRLMGLLERLQREQVFPFVSVDSDATREHLRYLRNYASKGLLPIGFKVWNPDFEASNFSYDELAKVANQMAADAGLAANITAAEIEQEMTKSCQPVGNTIKKLWSKCRFFGNKGAEWGKALADWASNNTCPASYADSEGHRPINALLFYLVRGQRSSYWETVKRETVDDNGNLIRTQ